MSGLRVVEYLLANRLKAGECLGTAFRESGREHLDFITEHRNRVADEADVLREIVDNPLWHSDSEFAKKMQEIFEDYASKVFDKGEKADKKVARRLGDHIFYPRWRHE